VIQEAAHEDANIIFGAVEDPNLAGKVKITVIATGFDRKPATRNLPASEKTTPVDLMPYTEHFARTAEAAAQSPAASHQASITLDTAYAGTGREPSTTRTAVAPVSVSRRQPVEVPLPIAVNGGASRTANISEDPPIDYSSPVDVPAFLRRQN
jgi:cell division protein FtsZ